VSPLINTTLGAASAATQNLSCFMTATTAANPQVRDPKLYRLPEIWARLATAALSP